MEKDIKEENGKIDSKKNQYIHKEMRGQMNQSVNGEMPGQMNQPVNGEIPGQMNQPVNDEMPGQWSQSFNGGTQVQWNQPPNGVIYPQYNIIPNSNRYTPIEKYTDFSFGEVFGEIYFKDHRGIDIKFCKFSIQKKVEIIDYGVVLFFKGIINGIIDTKPVFIPQKDFGTQNMISILQLNGIEFLNLKPKEILQNFMKALSICKKNERMEYTEKPGWIQINNKWVFLHAECEYAKFLPSLKNAKLIGDKTSLRNYLAINKSFEDMVVLIIKLISVLPESYKFPAVYIDTEYNQVNTFIERLQIYNYRRKNEINPKESWRDIKNIIRKLKNEPIFVVLENDFYTSYEKKKVNENIEKIVMLSRYGHVDDIEFEGIIIFLGHMIFKENIKKNLFYLKLNIENLTQSNIYIDYIQDFTNEISCYLNADKLKEFYKKIGETREKLFKIGEYNFIKIFDIMTDQGLDDIKNIIFYNYWDEWNRIEEENKKWHQLEGASEQFILRLIAMKENKMFNIMDYRTKQVIIEGMYDLYLDKKYILIPYNTFKDELLREMGISTDYKWVLDELENNEVLINTQTSGRKYSQQKYVKYGDKIERNYYLVLSKEKLEDYGFIIDTEIG